MIIMIATADINKPTPFDISVGISVFEFLIGTGIFSDALTTLQNRLNNYIKRRFFMLLLKYLQHCAFR